MGMTPTGFQTWSGSPSTVSRLDFRTPVDRQIRTELVNVLTGAASSIPVRRLSGLDFPTWRPLDSAGYPN
ncbi:MAG: hypothetical protein NVS9B1_26480 [Candidatus Dormibacteraceae bacterium]